MESYGIDLFYAENHVEINKVVLIYTQSSASVVFLSVILGSALLFTFFNVLMNKTHRIYMLNKTCFSSNDVSNVTLYCFPIFHICVQLIPLLGLESRF